MTTTLILTEKPDAALHVAEALGNGGPLRKVSFAGVPFFEIYDHDARLLVCSALGHLYGVAAKGNERRSEYPVWEFEWKPKHLIESGQGRQGKWIEAISRASKQADRFVDACDYDVEGSLIGYTILKFACNGADAKAQRMKFSTLTPKELREAYAKALPSLDFQLVYAGMCRHEVDWLFGINLSRALTQSALKSSKRYTTLSTGRVQGPTLKFIVDREREIQTFIPIPYWLLKAKFDVDGQVVNAECELGKIDVKAQGEQVLKECFGQKGVTERLETKESQISPPTPFDLSSLQGEAYRHFGYSPRVALSIAERLYLDQLISYPRTSSQKLPPSIGYEEVLKGLGKAEAYRSDVGKLLRSGALRPNEGRKADPAHPAVYPTGVLPHGDLDPRGRRLFDLVVRRFLATFGSAATRESQKAIVRVSKHAFFVLGSRITKKGWIEFYGPYARFEDVILPLWREGQEVTVSSIELEEKYSQPSPRYNPSSLLKAMEDAEIGTKATRADIIETLYRRRYVTGQRMIATALAMSVTEILDRYCPRVLDVGFTRELEKDMELIEEGEQNPEHVVNQTIQYLRPVIEGIKAREDELGTELTSILREAWDSSRTFSIPCPQCGSLLRVVKNRKTRKRFVGCSGKWKMKCTFALPLPQYGTLTLLERRCPECCFQLIQVKSKGRRRLVSCPRCFANKMKTKAGLDAAIAKPSAP